MKPHQTKKLILIIIFALAVNISAQTPITPHLTASSIRVEIPERTDVSPLITEGLIKLRKEYKLAYVNLQGQYVYGFDLKMQAVDMSSDYSGLFSCAAGVMSPKDGSYSLSPAILCQAGKMLMLDNTSYTKISDFVDGIAVAIKKVTPAGSSYPQDFLVYLNPQGKEVYTALSAKIESTFGFKLAAAPLSEGLRAYCNAATNQYGYIDANGKVIIAAKYAVAMPFSDGLAVVAVQESKYAPKFWGFIDKTGKEVIPCTYKQQPSGFSEGFAVVRTASNSWEDGAIFINKTGQKVSPDYKTANPFFGGYALASNQYGKAMVIDKNFNVLKTIDFPTDQLNNDNLRISEKNPFGLKFIDGIAAVRWVDDGFPYGNLITSDGNTLFEANSRNAMWNFYNGTLALCRYKIDGEEILGFVNKKGEFVIYFVENQNFTFTTPKPANAPCASCTENAPPPCPDVCNPACAEYDKCECTPEHPDCLPKCPDVCNPECPDYDFCKCNPNDFACIKCTDECDDNCPNFNPENCDIIKPCTNVCNPDCPNYNPNDPRCKIPECDICDPKCENYNPKAKECKPPRYSCPSVKIATPTYELTYNADCIGTWLKIKTLCPPDKDKDEWDRMGGDYGFRMQVEGEGGFASYYIHRYIRAGKNKIKVRFRNGYCTTDWFEIDVPPCPKVELIDVYKWVIDTCTGERYRVKTDTAFVPPFNKYNNCQTSTVYFNANIINRFDGSKGGTKIEPCENTLVIKTDRKQQVDVCEKYKNALTMPSVPPTYLAGLKYHFEIPAKDVQDDDAIINGSTICYPTTGKYHWWKGPAVINDTLDKEKGKDRWTIISTKVTVYLMLHDECKAENPYDTNACGLIWVVPDEGFMTQKRINELRFNQSMSFATGEVSEESVYQPNEAPKFGDKYNFGFPYAIFSREGNTISFGCGGNRTVYVNFKLNSMRYRGDKMAYGTTDDEDSDREWGNNLKSYTSGEIINLLSHAKFAILYMFAINTLKDDIQRKHSANLVQNKDGSIVMNGTLNSTALTLQPFKPDGKFAVKWFCPLGNIGKEEKDERNSSDFGVQIMKDIKGKHYPKLKGKN